MSTPFRVLLPLLSILAVAFSCSATAATEDLVKEWKFRVLLDGVDIGQHTYTLIDNGLEQRVASEAQFDARVMLLFKFKYRHSNSEVWRNDCLVEITAQTETNGKLVSLQGYQEDDAFVVVTMNQEQRLPECVKSFAYWDSQILEERQLVNQQTGRYQEVDITALDTQMLTIRGKDIPAQRYRLRGDKIELDIWYSATGEWLQLESKLKGGRIIRYQLT